MATIVEGALRFEFPESWQASNFDKWSFYRNQFQSVCCGAKAINILAVEPKECFWLIEVKDYRRQTRTKPTELAEEVALKVRDTLSALVAARINANEASERSMASASLKCKRLRIVLHLEQPTKHSVLFPRAIKPADVLQRLKQLIKAIDPHPLVLEMDRMRNMAWTVKSAGNISKTT